MALEGKSLFLYGITIDPDFTAIDFRAASDGPELQATLRSGYYSLSLALLEVKRALEEADPDNVYTGTADRTLVSNTENRINVGTSGTFFELLFGTGTRVDSSAGPTLGYLPSDYTGATDYDNNETLGTYLIPERIGYSYQPPQNFQKQEGIVTIAASGEKEAIIFSTQKFTEVTFKYEPEAKMITEWNPFWSWSTQIKPFDFTADYENSPSDVNSVTLESTSDNSQGLGWKMAEMLPSFPFMYNTGNIKMRLTPTGNS